MSSSAGLDPSSFDVLLIGCDPCMPQIAEVLSQGGYRTLRIPSVELMYSVTDKFSYKAIFILWDVLKLYTGSRLSFIQRLRFGPNVNSPILCVVENALKDAELDMLVQTNVVNCVLDPTRLEWHIVKQCVTACNNSIDNYLKSSAKQLISVVTSSQQTAKQQHLNPYTGLIQKTSATVETATNIGHLQQTKRYSRLKSNSKQPPRQVIRRSGIERGVLDEVRRRLENVIRNRVEKRALQIAMCAPVRERRPKKLRPKGRCDDRDGDAQIVDITQTDYEDTAGDLCAARCAYESPINQTSDINEPSVTKTEDPAKGIYEIRQTGQTVISPQPPPSLRAALIQPFPYDERIASSQPPKLTPAYSRLDKIVTSWRQSSNHGSATNTSTNASSSCSSVEDMQGIRAGAGAIESSVCSGRTMPAAAIVTTPDVLQGCYVKLKNMRLEAGDVLFVSD